MALVHRATLTPSERDLLGVWLPTRPWFLAGAEVLRLDDSAPHRTDTEENR